MSGGCPHRGRRGRIRPARIEQDRNLQSIRRQHGLAGFLAQRRSRSDARPADEDGGAVQILAAAGEDAAMHQIAHRVRLHARIKVAFARICQLGDIDELITDDGADRAAVAALEDRGVTVTTV